MLDALKLDLESRIDPEKAAFLPRFFKTGKGEYGQGDVFLGVVVPQVRQVAKKYRDLPLDQAIELLHSKYHEHRLCALVILTLQYPQNSAAIVDVYLSNTKYINNWDLVDLSAPNIIGAYCRSRADDSIICQLAKSANLWEKRISIVSCHDYYRHGELGPGLDVIRQLLKDPHDLIQKANGWMLREIYKNIDQRLIEDFIKENYSVMPRTTLRYAIEKMPAPRRQQFLKGEF